VNRPATDMVSVRLSLVEWESVLDALEYAVSDREEEAKYTKDPDDLACIEACSEEWGRLGNEIRRAIT